MNSYIRCSIITEAVDDIVSYIEENERIRDVMCDGCEWQDTPEEPERCPTAGNFTIPYRCKHAHAFVEFCNAVRLALHVLLDDAEIDDAQTT